MLKMLKKIKRLMFYILNPGKLKFLILFLLIALLGSAKLKLNNGDDQLNIISYKVKKYESLGMVCDKFHVTKYTIKTSNRIYNKRLYKGQKLLIPNKNVTIHKYLRHANLRKIAYKFYIRIKDISVFDRNLKPIEILDEDAALPLHGYVAVPQLQEKNFIWPTMQSKYVFSSWGWRQNPYVARTAEFHQGLDISANYEHVIAAKSGRVVYSGWLDGYGKCIIIEHVGGEKTVYGHMSRLFFRKGTYIKQGLTMGISGNTGRSTGPHLHFEIRKNDQPVNPFKYFWHGKRARPSRSV